MSTESSGLAEICERHKVLPCAYLFSHLSSTWIPLARSSFTTASLLPITLMISKCHLEHLGPSCPAAGLLESSWHFLTNKSLQCPSLPFFPSNKGKSVYHKSPFLTDLPPCSWGLCGCRGREVHSPCCASGVWMKTIVGLGGIFIKQSNFCCCLFCLFLLFWVGFFSLAIILAQTKKSVCPGRNEFHCSKPFSRGRR